MYMYSEYRTDESKPPKGNALETNTHASSGGTNSSG